MQRIMILGVSAGVGKSTFARKLGEALDLPVYHLDTMYWKPGWVEASFDEFARLQEEIASKQQWIIEGNYSNTYEIREKYADTIIYLELPLYICLYRVFKRWLQNIGKTRADMGEGCKEKIDYAFIKFILTTYDSRKEKMVQRLHRFQNTSPHNRIIMLHSQKEIDDFVERIKSGVIA